MCISGYVFVFVFVGVLESLFYYVLHYLNIFLYRWLKNLWIMQDGNRNIIIKLLLQIFIKLFFVLFDRTFSNKDTTADKYLIKIFVHAFKSKQNISYMIWIYEMTVLLITFWSNTAYFPIDTCENYTEIHIYRVIIYYVTKENLSVFNNKFFYSLPFTRQSTILELDLCEYIIYT